MTIQETDKDIIARALRDGLSEIGILDDWLEWNIDRLTEQMKDELKYDYHQMHTLNFGKQMYQNIKDRIKLIAETKREIEK